MVVWSCLYCPRTFSSESGQSRHKNKHHRNEGPIACGHGNCLRRFNNASAAGVHRAAAHAVKVTSQRKHHNRKAAREGKLIFACTMPNCTRAFETQRGLSHHINYGHSAAVIALRLKKSIALADKKQQHKFVCDVVGCTKSYSTNNWLVYHKREDHDITPTSKNWKKRARAKAGLTAKRRKRCAGCYEFFWPAEMELHQTKKGKCHKKGVMTRAQVHEWYKTGPIAKNRKRCVGCGEFFWPAEMELHQTKKGKCHKKGVMTRAQLQKWIAEKKKKKANEKKKKAKKE